MSGNPNITTLSSKIKISKPGSFLIICFWCTGPFSILRIYMGSYVIYIFWKLYLTVRVDIGMSHIKKKNYFANGMMVYFVWYVHVFSDAKMKSILTNYGASFNAVTFSLDAFIFPKANLLDLGGCILLENWMRIRYSLYI